MASLKSVAKDGPTMPLFGRLNNFMAWKTERLNVCCKEFGFLANVLKTNEPYVPDPVHPPQIICQPPQTKATNNCRHLEWQR